MYRTGALALPLLCLAVFGQEAAAPKPPKPVDATPPVEVAKPVPQATSLRNENVFANRIDFDVLKLSNVRLGDNVTLVPEPPVEASYYASEHGRSATEAMPLKIPAALPGWHGELFENLKNSAFNARTFFQAGPVQPSRSNQYGGRFSGAMPWLGAISGSFQQLKVRGMVNGNVLVPLADERTPLTNDPRVGAIVQRFLNAYPNEAPNRLDFDQRALNTNAPQRIDEVDGTLRLDRSIGTRNRLVASESIDRQRVDAFQLVAGQNPDTEVHSHRARATWLVAKSDATNISFGGGFTRVMSDLRSEPNAVGPRVRTGYQVEELGPDSQFPIHRAVNTFRWGSIGSHRSDRHTFTFGGDVYRLQLNGEETNNGRGVVWFGNNFGRTAIENMRMGTPTMYEVMIGDTSRGFRQWTGDVFVADQWKASSRLQVYYGVRYSFEATPTEVNDRDSLPYACDCNNVSPRVSLAYRGPADWVVRASYTVSFGQIFPVTYGQIRYNLPGVRYVQVQNPNLLDPLHGVDLVNGRTTPTSFSPDLVDPYVHQYNLSLEKRARNGWLTRVAYIGSRNFKMLDMYQGNRAEPVPGIPLTTATVDARRADPRYYDVRTILNSGVAYFDAGQATVEAPYWRGVVWGATYTFSKAIDSGSDYAGTAANLDVSRGRAQSQYLLAQDKKGLSNFDSPHSLTVFYAWDVPRPAKWAGLFGGWQVSGATLLKSGTPWTVYIGSDAPGFGNVDGGPSDRPNIVDPSILGMTTGNPDTAALILSRDRFSYMAPGESRGNLGRNTFRKGSIANVNAAVSKSWRAGANASVALRGEAYNLTNHPQFDEPQRNVTSPAFGKITNTLNDGRVIQIGLRVSI